MNSLRAFIIKTVEADFSQPSGTTLADHITRAVRTSKLAWTKPCLLSSPTSLQAVIDWEVNKFLTAKQLSSSENNTQKKLKKELRSKKAPRVNSVAAILQSKAEGVLVVISKAPFVGRLASSKLVVFEPLGWVEVGQTYEYWHRLGHYYVKGRDKGWVETSYGIPLGSEAFLQQQGDIVSLIQPDATDLDSKAINIPSMQSYNGFMSIYSDSEFATIEGTTYNEYTLAGTAEPTKTELNFSIDLSAYMPNEGRWIHSHPGKLLAYNGYAILSIMRIKDKEMPIDTNYPFLGTRTYAWHHTVSWIAYDILVINRTDKTISSHISNFSPLELQIMHTGYIDFIINPATGRLIVAKLDQNPSQEVLIAKITQLRVLKNAVWPNLAEDAILESESDVTEFLAIHGTFNSYLESTAETKNFTYGAYGLSIYEADIIEGKLELDTVAIYENNTPITELYGQEVVGGFTHVVLSAEPSTGELFLLRGYEAYFQTALVSEFLTPGTGSSGGFVPSVKYKEGIYPGDICMFGGNKLIRLKDNFELANIPGESSVPFSTYKNDPIGRKSMVGALTNSSIVKKFINQPRFSSDIISERLRTGDIASMFHGGSNDGEIYYDDLNIAKYVNSGNIYLNRARLITMRDLTQEDVTKQLRFIVQGIRHQVDQNALDAHIATAHSETVQAPFLIIPNDYSLTQDDKGYSIHVLGYTLPVYDTFAVDFNTTGYYTVTQMTVAKFDFIQASTDQVYVLTDGQIHNVWYRPGANAIGEKIAFGYSECWRLKGLELTGWAKDIEVFEAGRKNIGLVKLEGL